MTNDQRSRVSRSIDLTFQGSISEAEYEEMRQAAQMGRCANPDCGDEFNRSNGFSGPMIAGRGNRYCAPRCVEAAERKTAPYRQPTPKGEIIDGIAI